MGGLRTHILGALMALTLPLTGAAALPADPVEQARVFASCLGRFSAEMEHDWLMGGDGEAARKERRLFESLLDAVLPDASRGGLGGARLLHMRIEAKHAQARLLQAAQFQDDPRRAERAGRVALRHVSQCRALVLG